MRRASFVSTICNCVVFFSVNSGLIAFIALSAGFATRISVGQDRHEASGAILGDEGFSECWKQLQVIAEEIEKGHISPPARQQLYLGAVNGMYAANRQMPDRELATQISGLTQPEQFHEFLRQIWGSFSQTSGFDAEQTRDWASLAMAKSASPTMEFVAAKDHQIARQLQENQYVGMGIRLKFEDELPMIMEAFIGGPAHRAGARGEDWILAIDGKSTQGQPFAESVERLRGVKGSTLTVVLRNRAETNERQYTIVRDVVPIATVQGTSQNQDGSWQLASPGANQIAQLRFESIVGSSAAELSQLASQIRRDEYKAVLLDFRGVGLADLHHTIMLADSLIGAADLGRVIAVDGTSQVKTRAEEILPDVPLAVLADTRVSGSVFMLLAGLKHARGAKIIGGPIDSDGLCFRSVELADALGAIENMPYAVFLLHPKSDDEEIPATGGHALMEQGTGWLRTYSLAPDMATEATGDELTGIALKFLQEQ